MLRLPLYFLLLAWTLSSGVSCSLLRPSAQLSPLAEETAGTLQPGLMPRYFAKFMARDVRELPEDTDSPLKTWLGDPVPQLDNQFGEGEVFGSGLSRGVGVRMRGAIHCPVAGTYAFQASSNDGIQLYLGETLVISDPRQHADRLSKETAVEIPVPGWYPVRVDYFQRKGTAALQLFWTTPDSGGTRTIVPAEAFGHLP